MITITPILDRDSEIARFCAELAIVRASVPIPIVVGSRASAGPLH